MKKRGKKFRDDVEEFMVTAKKLFDIFCDDPGEKRKLELLHQLRMSEADYSFYEDQKDNRVAKTVLITKKLTSSDVQFARKAQAAMQKTAQQTIENPCTSAAASSKQIQYKFPCDTEMEYPSSGSESNCSFLWEDRPQNATSYKNLAMACARYSVSDKAAAAIASTTLKDHGLVTDDDNVLVTQ